MDNSVIYCRVTSKKNGQKTDRQIYELDHYANKLKINVDTYFCENGSGEKKLFERKVLLDCINYCVINKVKNIIITEISRIGRGIVLTEIIETLNKYNINLIVKDISVHTINIDGTLNVEDINKIYSLIESTKKEVSLVRSRMISGYEYFRATGGVVGRKKGYSLKEKELKLKYKDIISYLKAGLSIREIARLTNNSPNTVMKMKKIINKNL